ncbi:MAG: ATP-grasp domain-containing protein [Myxococcota bacterium]
MSKRRILAIMHEDLVPPNTLRGVAENDAIAFRTEWHVVSTLKRQRHEVIKLGLRDEIAPLRHAIEEHKPHLVFNLLEEFHGEATFDQHVVAYLELLRQPYTGCNPRGLTLARDKALSKKILAYHRIPVPKFFVVPRGRKPKRPRRIDLPLIVKSLVEEASTGISQASVVDSDEKLNERVRFIHERVRTDAIVEQYIEGREIYVGVLGNDRLTTFPTWELILDDMPDSSIRIATEKVKWDDAYRWKHRIDTRAAKLEEADDRRVQALARRIYRRLGLSGYARLDFRLRSDGTPFLLEANPNPNIARDDEFALSARHAGWKYQRLLSRILRLGLRAAGQ